MNETVNIVDFEQHVRERAYALWESEGRTHGRDVEHWHISEEALRAELAPAPQQLHAEPAPEQPVAEPEPVQAAAEPTPEAVVSAVKAAAKQKAAPRKKKVAAKMSSPIRAMSATLQ